MGQLLLQVGVILLAARIAGALCERVGVPALIGEIGAGVVLGKSVLDFVHVGGHGAIAFMAELGAIFLLFAVGTETDVQEMLRVGMAATRVAIVGVVVPMLTGYGVAIAAGYSWSVGLFLGGALSATSVGITARVFGDIRALGTSEARVVLGAAVIDDVLGLIILAIVVPIAGGDSISGLEILSISGKALAFVGIGGGLCVVTVPRIIDWIDHRLHSPQMSLMLGIGGALCGAAAAHVVGLAPIVGAMLVGLGVAGSRDRVAISRDLEAISGLFIPIFFASIGIGVDIGSFVSAKVLTLTAALCVVAVLGKVVGGVVAGVGNDRRTVGWGMVPRGEVGLIFASVGLAKGVLSSDLAAAVVAMVLVTTIAAPPMLTRRLKQLGFSGREESGARDGSTTQIAWDMTETNTLVSELSAGETRSLDLLQSTGTLEHVLPEMARYLSHRRRDQATSRAISSHFPTLERVKDVESSDALLAAVYVDVAEHVDETAAANLMRRLAPIEVADRVVAEAFDARQIAELASTPYGANERRIHALADHVQNPDRLRAAALLASALGSEEAWFQDSVGAVRDAIAQELGAGEMNVKPSETRRQSAMQHADRSEVRERLEHAPPHVFSAADPATLARRLELLEPPPMGGRFRVQVTEVGDGYEVDVVTRDRPKLLARITLEFHELDMEILEIHGATWGDGLVYDRFKIQAAVAPDAVQIRRQLEAAVTRRRVRAIPLPALDISVSNLAHPFLTVLRIDAGPSTSTVPAVVGALARSGIVIHSIEVTQTSGSEDARTHLTLDIAGANGLRLDESDIRAAFAG